MNIKCGNNFNQSLLGGCDFRILKKLKLVNTNYIVNKRQILEYIDFNDMTMNYDSFLNLLLINNNTLKTIIFNNVSLYNKIVNDIQLQKITQIIPCEQTINARPQFRHASKNLVLYRYPSH